ncbi:MAG: hypothetical protein C5B50_10355 [Verrucomicrobia bacterium]|nr:MAG: hypothetical protein C5B50_10355 [Verrucomicrobiota bacterium]
MALILRNPDGTYASKCALCGEVLSGSIFATGRFITNKFHEFYRFSDVAMHWSCYVKWPQQSRFASLYFEAALIMRERMRSQNWKTLLKSPEAFVGYLFAEHEVSLIMRKSGTDVRLHRSRWQAWLNGGWQRECRPELEREAISAILSQLQELQLPDPP